MEKHDGQLPEVETMINFIWNGDMEDDLYKELLLFYVDGLLECGATRKYYGETWRKYHVITDKIDVEGKQLPAVSVQSEAFLLLTYANCRKKWMDMYKFKQDNPNDAINEKDFPGVYTKPEAGNVSHGGWSNDGIELFQTLIDRIKNFRAQDEKDDKVRQKFALKLIRDLHDITEEMPTKKTRKRRSSANHSARAAPALRLDLEEEEDE